MNCDKCGCEGRVAHVEENEDGAVVQYACPNRGCARYRSVFGEKTIER